MDKLKKFLQKLSKKEFEAMELVLAQIKLDYKKVPGIIKLSGHKNLFRVRVGIYRIIFSVNLDKIVIIKITKRDDNTYNNL